MNIQAVSYLTPNWRFNFITDKLVLACEHIHRQKTLVTCIGENRIPNKLKLMTTAIALQRTWLAFQLAEGLLTQTNTLNGRRYSEGHAK